ncbi:MAG: carbohydrate kinase [Paracoccaceae bacterium]
MFLICGEALFDLFASGGCRAAFTLEARAGGSPYNVAVGMARLGAPAALFTAVSDDMLGQALKATLAEEGVDTSFLIDGPHRTTLSLASIGKAGVAAFRIYGEGGADRMIDAASLPAAPARLAGLHFGSYTMVVEPVATTHFALARREAAFRIISFDPNVRPNVEPDMGVWRRAAEEMSSLADIVKISADDAALIWPGRPLGDILDWFRERGAALAIGTMGAAGAMAVGGFGELEIAPAPARVVDTVGAGDSFMAAVLAGTLAQAPGKAALKTLAADDARAILDFAASAAAVSCSRRGADPPRREEIAVSRPL